MQHAVKSPMAVVEECFWGKNCSPCAGVTGQGNHSEFIPTVSMESQHSTGMPTCHDFPRFVIVSEKLRPEVRNRWLCTNFVKFGRPEVGEIARCLMDKRKNKILARAPASARIVPKICHSSKQYTWSSPNFIRMRSLPAEL